MFSRLAYLSRMTLSWLNHERLTCPNCGGRQTDIVSRKYVVTALLRCRDCLLQFRAPTDSESTSWKFYNKFYQQGVTTQMPSRTELDMLLRSHFADSGKNFDRYVSVLLQLGLRTGDRLFDFGCSWGYGAWQFQQAGFDVWASEIAVDRARYARDKLGVRMLEDMESAVSNPDLAGSFDCFVSTHVIEHVPAPAKVFELAGRLLKQNGVFVSFTPNGSTEHRKTSAAWDQLWGERHPNFIDPAFLQKTFGDIPQVYGSRAHEELDLKFVIPDQGSIVLDLTHYELMFAARYRQDIWPGKASQ